MLVIAMSYFENVLFFNVSSIKQTSTSMLIAVIGSVDPTDRNFDEVIACFAEPLLDSPLFTEATTSLYDEESSRVSGHKPNQQPVMFFFFSGILWFNKFLYPKHHKSESRICKARQVYLHSNGHTHW